MDNVDVVEALAEQRRNLGTQHDATIAELKRVRAVAKTEIECLEADNKRLRVALHDARMGLNLALLASGLDSEIKGRLRTAWLKVGDALTLKPNTI